MAEFIVTEENFENEVLLSEIPVLVDFWAEWCGPCRMLAPTVEQISKDYDGRIKVGKVNIDEQESLAVRFGIASIPTLLLFKDGKVAAQSIGFCPKEDIEKMLEL